MLVVAGVSLLPLLAWLGYRKRDSMLPAAALGCAALVTVLAVGYLLNVIQDSDLVAGSLMILLPLAAGGFVGVGRAWRMARYSVTAVALVVGAFALALTPERSAWFGLAAGCAGVALWVWRCDLRRKTSRFRWLDAGLLVLILGALAVYLLMLLTPSFDSLVAQSAQLHPTFARSLTTRVTLWRDTLWLIQDFPFSGSGLGSTAMVYSSYVYLLHVPYQYHAHNLYLQIAVEQGLPGSILFCVLLGLCLWYALRIWSKVDAPARLAVLGPGASLIALATYGFLDSEPYVDWSLPSIFLPLGFVAAIAAADVRRTRCGAQYATDTRVDSRDTAQPRTQHRARAGLVGVAAAIALLLLSLSAIRLYGGAGVLAANLGAVAQGRAELSVYEWPEWPMQDAVRQREIVDLSRALHFYTLALAMDADNEVAHRRLGQIYLSQANLSREQQELACRHLSIAYDRTSAHRATRQLLGECFALQGQPDRAALLWKSVDTNQGQLDLRLWWHERNEVSEHTLRMVDALHIHAGIMHAGNSPAHINGGEDANDND